MNKRKLGQIVKAVEGKKTRLGVHINNGFINFCTLSFSENGSLMFSSKFHNTGKPIELGSTKLESRIFGKHAKEEIHKVQKGCHISLHPPEENKRGVMHLRENYPGKIIENKVFDWFPVFTPFNLLHLYTPPLDICELSDKKSDFFTPLPEKYTNSVQLKVDIFPRNTTEHYLYKNSYWDFWGYCPNYFVRISYLLTNQRLPSCIYWLDGDGLKL